MVQSPTQLNTLSHNPSTSSFGGSSFLKPRFISDPKAREAYKVTNLGNPLIRIDDTSVFSKGSKTSRNAGSHYNSVKIASQKPIELYGDAKEQLDRESADVGRKVCGFTRTSAHVPSDYMYE